MVDIRSIDRGSVCRVIGYSVNEGKSMNLVSMPDLRDHNEASKGYIGYDEFAIVETSLVQRFPMFKFEGSAYEPKGTTRQIEYRLEEGESSRQFRISKISEYEFCFHPLRICCHFFAGMNKSMDFLFRN